MWANEKARELVTAWGAASALRSAATRASGTAMELGESLLSALAWARTWAAGLALWWSHRTFCLEAAASDRRRRLRTTLPGRRWRTSPQGKPGTRQGSRSGRSARASSPCTTRSHLTRTPLQRTRRPPTGPTTRSRTRQDRSCTRQRPCWADTAPPRTKRTRAPRRRCTSPTRTSCKPSPRALGRRTPRCTRPQQPCRLSHSSTQRGSSRTCLTPSRFGTFLRRTRRRTTTSWPPRSAPCCTLPERCCRWTRSSAPGRS